MATQQAPFGDIVAVNTPYLDRVGQQLYAEQKIRTARQQQEDAALDANIQKEIGKVRSVDTPDVINSYNQYKTLKKQLLFNKDLQKDPLAYNQLQQEAKRAYQNIFSTANKSAELKEMQKTLTTDRIKNPNAYSDDFGLRMATLMNTPVSGVNNNSQFGDLANWDDYMYRGANTNWSEHVAKGAGSPRRIAGSSENLPGGLQTTTPIYEYGNTPAHVKDYLLGTMALRQAGRDAAYTWDHLPEDEIKSTIDKYRSIPKSDWERMGLQGPQDLLPKNPDNKAENLASYYAMKYAVDNRPRLVENKLQDNKKAIMDLNWERDKVMEGIRYGHQKELKKQEQEAVNNWIVGYWDQRITDAKSGRPATMYDHNAPLGMRLTYKVKPDAVMMKGLARNGQEPDEVVVTDDNKIIPVFYKYGAPKGPDGKVIEGREKEVVVQTNPEGNPIIDDDYSKPMDIDQAYLSLGYKGQTKKQLQGTMEGAYNKKEASKEKYPLPEGKPRVVKQNGYTYEWNPKTGKYE